MPQLSPLEQQVLATFCARLDGLLGRRLARVVLFGSRARGEGHEHSDLDLLVIADGVSDDDVRSVMHVAADISLDSELLLTPLVRDRAWLASSNALAHTIEREGLPLLVST